MAIIKTMDKLLTITKGSQRVYLQDLGRTNARKFGVTTSGAADEYSFLSANQLVKNPANTPALEVVFGDISITMHGSAQLAICGLAIDIKVNDVAINTWQSFNVQAGDEITIAPFTKGNYAYIACNKGFANQNWLNSACPSPNAKTSLDYFVMAVSSLANQTPKQITQPQNFQASHFYPSEQLTLRFMPNQAWQLLNVKQQQAILAQQFSIDSTSSKMGYRMNLDITNDTQAELATSLHTISNHCGTLSKPVVYGQIQLPSTTQWIVLMKDRQTIGGYPSIGTVIKTDLFRLAQLKPNQQVCFSPISLEQAQLQLTAFYQRFGL